MAETKENATATGNGKPREIVPKDRIRDACHRGPESLFVRFEDGFEATVRVADLGLVSPKIDWTSLEVSPTGDAVTILVPTGERVPIDAGSLRCLADGEYAAEVRASLERLKLSRTQLVAASKKSQPIPAWALETPQSFASHGSDK